MEWDTLLYDQPEPGIAVVTFNRPERANAMNQHMLAELDQLCTLISRDDGIRAVIVTGAGKAFSSGFDLKAQAEATPQGVREWEPVLEADFRGIMSFWNLAVPTIAAVNGPALAGGFELMMGCDLALSVESAVFGEPELKFGAGIVAMLLPWHVPPKIAKGVIFTGEDSISAPQALDWGLINRIVPAEDLLAEAVALARRISRLDAMAMRRTKQAMHRSYELMGMQAALRASLDIDILLEGEGTDLKRGFLKVLRDQGLGKALAWREARFAGA
ncbi:enoyl-CoA hydratase/isomerase family protein (plasmid) [Paracoccus denitrificans]|uniref:enoyl-CoA hydratase/isomerase family protein n=1 Tax=Paracoccus denitrificans TaxID=266 RepID=UPI001E352E5C|nr:enoyl-CoA hydratase/isomerase family protein [Paracoccus denitrificans]UFS68046.1 enoyl-CoA hydratase/isomerase family protein [Paracoccus denitrificans]